MKFVATTRINATNTLMKSIVVAFATLTSGCFGSETLDCKSSSAFKGSLAKIYESKNGEIEKLEICKSIIHSVEPSRTIKHNIDSGFCFNIYDNLSSINESGRLMALDGKNTAEVIKIGTEKRKGWVENNHPKQIEKLKLSIAELENKKLRAQQIEETKKLARIDNIETETTEMFAAGKNTPMGFIDKLNVRFLAINDGSVDIYMYKVHINVFDSANRQRLDADKHIEFHNGVSPKSSQKSSTVEIGLGFYRIPIQEKDKLTVNVTLVDTNTKGKERFSVGEESFSSWDERYLTEQINTLAQLEAELAKFK